MKERPILFSGVMVRALLDGRKTQTRRVLKVQPDFSVIKAEYRDPNLWEFRKRFMMYADDWSGYEHAMYRKTERGDPDLPIYQHRSPFGEPGDRLWVRETHVAFGRWETRFNRKKARDEWHFVDLTLEAGFVYRFDGADPDARRRAGAAPTWHTRPSIFMPRAASRITLEVTGVRVERLRDISEADAIAEGAQWSDAYQGFHVEAGTHFHATSARESYLSLWDSLNAARGYGSDVNPWVWVVEFRRVL